mgnify:CR=1 FL=1
MTGEEKGKLRNRRWWDWYDGLPHAEQLAWRRAQDDHERYPCDIFPPGTPGGDRWCFHTGCGVKAGLLPRIVLFNNQFRDDAYRNWLRFCDVKTIAKAYWVMKKIWLVTGEYSSVAAAQIGVMN